MPHNGELSGVRILVVEDEPETLELVTWLLRDAGATVTSAPTVGAALDVLAVDRPDVVVSDLNLPDADGCELVRRLRSAGGDPVRAIALSASASMRDASRALGAGFDVHVAKPITQEDLIEAVRVVTAPR